MTESGQIEWKLPAHGEIFEENTLSETKATVSHLVT
jgi:hypothetical protein